LTRNFRRFCMLLALVLPFTMLTATNAAASSASEFTSRTNSERTSRGIRAYAVRGDLASVAARQAARMAAARSLYHNPRLGSEVSGWSSVGENVGRGSSVSAIHSALMDSAPHRANILSTSFTEVGIGTARSSDGELYVSEVFRRPNGTPTYTPPPPPRVAPRPVVRRASRSAPRRALPVRVTKHRKARVVDHTPARLRFAWKLYRRDRPVSSMERVVTYLRVGRILAA
jgi:hypothetical protein